MTVKKWFDIGVRLGLTTVAIGAIGWGFVALNPPDDDPETPTIGVQESSADIFSMSFAAPTSTQRLQSALDRLGHEKPRVYDLNGNTVMFSTSVMRGTPRQVVDRYMRVFFDEGVNPVIIQNPDQMTSEDREAIVDARVKGGVVPTKVSKDYFVMGGSVLNLPDPMSEEYDRVVGQESEALSVLLKEFPRRLEECGGNADDYYEALRNPTPEAGPSPDKRVLAQTKSCAAGEKDDGGGAGGFCNPVAYEAKELTAKRRAAVTVVQANPGLKECRAVGELMSALAGTSYDAFSERIKAFRSIEGWYNEQTGQTRIAATWSDESFDMKKAQPSRFGTVVQGPAADKLPLCAGCRRTWAFQGTGSERDYSSHIIVSSMSPSETAQRYERLLLDQGWEIPESELVVDEMARIAGKTRPTDDIWLRMNRGNDFLALRIAKDEDGRTIVSTTIAP